MAIFNTVYGGGGTSSKYKYLTYTLDQTQSAPGSMITAVSDDAKSMTANDVLQRSGAYPVLLNNSWAEYRKLNPNNFQQFDDGTDASSYTASTSYDVMIKFPRRWYNISTSNNITTFSLTDEPNNPEYTYFPWQRITAWTLGSGSETLVDLQAFYLWAYMGINSSGLRSRYNQSISVWSSAANGSIGAFNGYAKNRWTGWGITEFVQNTYLELLFMAAFKTTNAQSAIWNWYVGASSKINTGTINGSNNNYMTYWSTANQTTQMRFLWIEWWYWNVWEWVNWWNQTSSWIYISIPNATGTNRPSANWTTNADSSSIYTPTNCSSVQSSISLTDWAYITKVKWDNLCWFTPTSNSWGGDSTYFTDYARWGSSSRVARFGGDRSRALRCGAFFWDLDNGASDYGSAIGARLMFLPTS